MKSFGALSAAALRTVQPGNLIHAGGAADRLAVLHAAGQCSSTIIVSHSTGTTTPLTRSSGTTLKTACKTIDAQNPEQQLVNLLQAIVSIVQLQMQQEQTTPQTTTTPQSRSSSTAPQTVLQTAGQGPQQQSSVERQTREGQITPTATLQTAGQLAAPKQGAELSVEGVFEHWANALFKARCDSFKNADEVNDRHLKWLASTRAKLKDKQEGTLMSTVMSNLTFRSNAAREDIEEMDKHPYSKVVGKPVAKLVEVERDFDAGCNKGVLTREDKNRFGQWCLLVLQQDALRRDQEQRRQVVTLLEKVHQSLIKDGDKFGCSPSRQYLLEDFALATGHIYDPISEKSFEQYKAESEKRFNRAKETKQYLPYAGELIGDVIRDYDKASSCLMLFEQFFNEAAKGRLVYMTEHLKKRSCSLEAQAKKSIDILQGEPWTALVKELKGRLDKSGKLDDKESKVKLQKESLDQMAELYASLEFRGELGSMIERHKNYMRDYMWSRVALQILNSI